MLLLARGLHGLGRRIAVGASALRAVDLYARAFSLNPALRKPNWPAYVDALKGGARSGLRPWMIADLRRACGDGSARPADLMPAICQALADQGVLTAIAEAGDLAQLCRSLAQNLLLLTALMSAPMAERRWEAALTRLRHRLLDAVAADAAPFAEPAATAFIVALAEQCALTEYIFSESAAEAEPVERLARLAEAEAPKPAMAEVLLAVLALYRMDAVQRLVAQRPPPSPSPAIAALIRRHVEEPAREAELARAIPRIDALGDAVSRAVRDQYEENPYPRWTVAHTQWPALAAADTIQLLVPSLRGRAPPLAYQRMLVAGCGTGRQLVELAALFPKARILGIDLSVSSLGYAKRKALEAGLGNVEVRQADILGLGAMAERFDLILCSGVLHHMAEPETGLKILASLLKPSGLINIGLYSRIAREHLAPIQDYIKANRLPPTAQSVRRLRELIRSGAFANLIEPGEHSDFYTLSECRDLLFHAHEDLFTIERIEQALAANRLGFLGFSFGDRSWPALYAREFPDDPAMLSLGNWRGFETRNRRCFAQMYQFWATAAR
jgi:2-polyprenyl-3-methyl-5-hydroxy-6-metoxy-1,4-benzoquinol methylase